MKKKKTEKRRKAIVAVTKRWPGEDAYLNDYPKGGISMTSVGIWPLEDTTCSPCHGTGTEPKKKRAK